MSRNECNRCGRAIPQRRQDSDFCSKKCEDRQAFEDRESAKSEREAQDVVNPRSGGMGVDFGPEG